MEISCGVMRDIGPCKLGVGIEHDFTVQAYSYYEGFYISGRKRKAQSERLGALILDLYTVSPSSDLRERTDAVLVRECDKKRVEVLSGGGYNLQGERLYDNIFLRVKPPVIIVIQRYRKFKRLMPIDYFYLVTPLGVKEIMPRRGDDATELAEVSTNVDDWMYI
ncbi:hypothetical protein J6X15_03105 [Candidatus Saccharibacteria bacterium]|nr:hypothetical protein [Candidatus Saccharibacteria bacterium]